MKKGKISGIIGAVIATIIIVTVFIQFYSINENSQEKITEQTIIDVGVDDDVDDDGIPDEEDPLILAPRVWQTSGPFQIDKKEYRLGELVLIRMGGIAQNEKGQIAFLRPLNTTHYEVYITIPFDGSQKITFNQYFKPALSTSTGTCSKQDLLGNWTVVFQGTNYENIKFEIIDEIIPGDEEQYEKKIC